MDAGWLRFFVATVAGLLRDVGPGAQAVRQIVDIMVKERHKGIVYEVSGWAVFVMAAVGLFNALQFALNTVWGVSPSVIPAF
jgi:uncharacterized BrkB/YihY/UPF0761 family membrane protein